MRASGGETGVRAGQTQLSQPAQPASPTNPTSIATYLAKLAHKRNTAAQPACKPALTS